MCVGPGTVIGLCPIRKWGMLSYHGKNVIFMHHQKMEPPDSTVAKSAETIPTVALTRALLSQGPGGGGKYTFIAPIPTCTWTRSARAVCVCVCVLPTGRAASGRRVQSTARRRLTRCA